MDGKIVNTVWFDSQCAALLLKALCEELREVLLVHEGVITARGRVLALLLCGQCWGCLKKERMPDLSLANHLFLGDVPTKLRDLTMVEEAMITHCRAKLWIIQLQEQVGAPAQNAQHGMCGHVIVYPQEPDKVVNLLPPSIEDVVNLICIIFVGSSQPLKEWL